MRLVFLVQASPTIGLGHVMRCMAVAQAAAEPHFQARENCQVAFLLDAFSKQAVVNRPDWVGDIMDIADYQPQTVVAVIESLQLASEDWLFIDGYHFQLAEFGLQADRAFRVAAFDDNHIEHPVAIDAVINSAPNALAKIKYRDFTATNKIMLGAKYRPLRIDFRQTAHVPFEKRAYLTLCFGGTDPLGLTLPLLKALQNTQFTGPIRVVTGAGFSQLEDLEVLLEQSPYNIEHLHNADNMAEIWQQSRLAVSAAGGSQFELAVCRAPSVLVMVADNQVAASQEALQKGWCEVVDGRAEASQAITEIVANITRLWPDEASLHGMYDTLHNRYDADGTRRIMEALIA